MPKYAFELHNNGDGAEPKSYRLVHLGRLWSTEKDVYLVKQISGNTYFCRAEYKGESADSRGLSRDSPPVKLVDILKKQGIRNRKALMEAKFPKGADQRVLDCWALILNCLSFSGKH